jgi:hypothetical protein
MSCMSRSRVLVAFLAAALFALTARSAPAAESTLLDAIGSVDYAHGRSIIQPGSWASYRMTTSNDKRVIDDCTVTIMIAGEEEWWGEDCFWVETLTQRSKGSAVPAATLMSFAIFEDSLPLSNILLYQRKRIGDVDENGQPIQQTMRRGPTAIKARPQPKQELTVRTDTLGTDTLKTVQGDLVCLKVRSVKGFSATSQSADSSRYDETREVRVTHVSTRIPVTGNAHEEVETTTSSRTWATGHSSESSPLELMSRTKVVLELVGYGTQGRESTLVPAQFHRSLAEQRAAAAPRPKAPTAKPRTRTH